MKFTGNEKNMQATDKYEYIKHKKTELWWIPPKNKKMYI